MRPQGRLVLGLVRGAVAVVGGEAVEEDEGAGVDALGDELHAGHVGDEDLGAVDVALEDGVERGHGLGRDAEEDVAAGRPGRHPHVEVELAGLEEGRASRRGSRRARRG